MTMLAAALLLIVCVLGVHWPTGTVDFVFDDDVFVVGNPAAQSVSAAVRAALQPFPANLPARGLYRPLTALSYGLDADVWGRSARGFAITNALLYLAVALLAWSCFSRLLPSAPAAFAAALLFAVHPVHAEAVDAIAGRSELLALLFSLLALLAFQRGLKPTGGGHTTADRSAIWPWAWLSALAYALGCAAKETAVVLPAVLAAQAVILCLEGRLGPKPNRLAPRLLLPHLLVLAAYLAVRWKALGGFAPSRSLLSDADPLTRLATTGAVFAEYLRLLVFPATLQTDSYYLAKVGTPHALSVPSAVGLAGLAALLLASLLAARRLARRPDGTDAPAKPGCTAEGAFLLGVTIFLVFLLPVSHLLPMGALMAERFLFAPSFGFVLAIVAAAFLLNERSAGRRFSRSAVASVLVGILVVIGAARSHARSSEWRDAARLWESSDRATPGDIRVQTNLAAELLQRGDLDRAERVLRTALDAHPDVVRPTYNLGLIVLQRGDTTQATALFEEVLRLDPDNVETLVELAKIATRRGERLRAAALLTLARSLAAGRADLEQRILALERDLPP